MGGVTTNGSTHIWLLEKTLFYQFINIKYIRFKLKLCKFLFIFKTDECLFKHHYLHNNCTDASGV